MNHKTAFSILLFLLLVGCVGKNHLPTATPIPTSTATNLPAKTAAPARTATTRASATATLTETPTAQPAGQVEMDCLVGVIKQPMTNTFPGIGIFENPSEKIYELYDFQTGEKTGTPIKSLFDVVVSPNRKFYAYHNERLQKLLIYSPAGKLLHSITWEKDWGYVGKWQDNERLLIELSKPNEGTPNWDEYPRTLMLLNPSTGERRVLPPDFPNIDTGTYIEWGGSGSTIYDPSITRVVFPGYTEGTEGLTLILRDIPGNRDVAHLPVSPGGTPVWSEDGTGFLTNGPDGEFFWVSRGGKVTQVTHLNTGAGGTDFYSTNYSLSPDGKTAAIWLETITPKRSHLALIDLSTGKVRDLCLSQVKYSGFAPVTTLYSREPIWSPDGKYILTVGSIEESGESLVLVINLEADTAQVIDTVNRPVGWLAVP